MALEEKNPTRNVVSGIMIAVSGYYYGYTFPIFNSMATPMFCGYFGLTEDEKDGIQGTLNFLFCFAAMFGGLVMGFMNTHFGRLRTGMYSDCSIVLVGLLFQFDSVWAIMAGRILSGAITGMYTMNAAISLVDLLPTHLAGHCYMIQNMINGLLVLVSFQQQIWLTQKQLSSHWKIILVWPSCISVIRIIYYHCTFKTDSPVYLFNKYRNDPSLRARLKQSFGMIYKDKGLDAHIDKFISEKSMSELQSTSMMESIGELFNLKYRSKTVGCLLLTVAEALTGYPFLILFSTVFFDRLGIDGKSVSLVLGVFNVVGPLLGLFTVNRFTRKGLMVAGVCIQGIAFLAMWLSHSFGYVGPVAVSLALFMIAYYVGIGTIHIIYISEVLPSQGFNLTLPTAWLMWSIVGKASMRVAKVAGETTTLVGYGLLCAGFALLLQYVLISTSAEDSKLCTQQTEERPLLEGSTRSVPV